MDSNIKTWHIHIKGLVQGVGYRPLVHKLALEYGLFGFVKNGTDGLHVQINCDEETTDNFIQDIIKNQAPPLAQISAVHKNTIKARIFEKFTINHDESDSITTELSLTPDFALCKVCKEEMSDENNRRFNYGFITCTKCGPRFSIIQKLPYDRIRTEMGFFNMCSECQKEYNESEDRRYFSQTNSCLSCGIQLTLYNHEKKHLTADTNEICSLLIKAWSYGKIVAIKGIGGYLLTCDASNSSAVSLLRSWKNRPSKPLALMYPSLHSLSKLQLNTNELEALNSPSAPIVLISKKEDYIDLKYISENDDRVGVMIPYAPIFQLLLSRYKKPIVATSANKHKSPIIFQNEPAIKKLSGIADYILTNNREITLPQDDSVITFSAIKRQKIIMRRSRGLAPNYLNTKLDLALENGLAMGADQKSSFALLKNNIIHLSQFQGDLSDYEVQNCFENCLDHFLKLLIIKPKLILIDKHPNYISTQVGIKYASKWKVNTLAIQHHHAHFCALLGEHALLDSNKKILGVIWDGTGLGEDGKIWGGEFFYYQNHQIERCTHLAYYKHIAKDKMAKEPRLSALALLADSRFKDSLLKEKFTNTEWNIYKVLLKKDTIIETSSMGRLFDALASILGILDKQSFEGEAASIIEVLARKYFNNMGYQIALESYFSKELDHKLLPQKVMESVIKDVRIGTSKSEIVAKFHLTLVHWIEDVAKAEGCKKIGFSGGVFQNSLLVDLIILHLENNFELYFHQDLPPNDENIAFGQLVYASIRK